MKTHAKASESALTRVVFVLIPRFNMMTLASAHLPMASSGPDGLQDRYDSAIAFSRKLLEASARRHTVATVHQAITQFLLPLCG